MRILILVPVILALAIAPTRAQVTIDLRALDALPLPGSRPPPQQSAPFPRQPEARRTPMPPASTQPAAQSAATPTREATLPIVTPPAAETTPIPAVPAASASPPPAPPVTATSTTRAGESAAGMRLTFDAAATDLSAASMDAIRRYIGAAPNRDTATFNVLAYAAGKADDPSVARRLSLSRALAVRTALIAEGVASSRILVRALGAQAAGGPPDRVDVSLLGANATP